MAPRERDIVERLLEALERDSDTLWTLREQPEELAARLGLNETELAALRSADRMVSNRRSAAEVEAEDLAQVFGARTERVLAELRKHSEGDRLPAGADNISSPSGGLTRRDALRRGMLVTGAALWATPLVQTIRTRHAAAQVSRVTFTTGTTITGRPR